MTRTEDESNGGDESNIELIRRTLAEHGYNIIDSLSSDSKIFAEEVAGPDQISIIEGDGQWKIDLWTNDDRYYYDFDEMYTAMMRHILMGDSDE